jgi:CRP/FNR family cyclic AMP-dependent transcriptional regulator
MSALVELLRGVELFAGLDAGQLAQLAAITRLEEIQDGDVVFSQGEQGQALYVIDAGQVEVILPNSRTAAFLGPGQIFGEMALVDYGLRSATIRCASGTARLAVIQREDFERLCAADTAIGYVVMRNVASDLSFKLRHRNQELPSD